MEPTLTEKEIVDQLAELQLSFPIVAPRLLMNFELDRDPYYGFDTPVHKTMAKYQVPFLIESYLRLGAFAEDPTCKCGYRPLVRHRVSDGTSLTREKKSEYLRNFANLVTERVAEGHPHRMAAATFVMTQEQHDDLIKQVMPIFQTVRSVPPSPDTKGVRIMFCTVMENN